MPRISAASAPLMPSTGGSGVSSMATRLGPRRLMVEGLLADAGDESGTAGTELGRGQCRPIPLGCVLVTPRPQATANPPVPRCERTKPAPGGVQAISAGGVVCGSSRVSTNSTAMAYSLRFCSWEQRAR